MAEVARRLRAAPEALQAGLPRGVNGVIGALHAGGTGAATDAWLRESIAFATQHLFAGVAVLAALMLLVLACVPRHFPVLPQEQG